MAKEKAKKGVPNKHLHARIAFLHQAATYLNTRSLGQTQNGAQESGPAENPGHPQPVLQLTTIPPGTIGTNATHALTNTKPSPGHPSTATFNPPPSGLPLQLNSHLRSVAQKAQIRLSSDLKHAICKICCSPLIEGETCLRSVENLSKGGRKPWADILVLKCCACGACKRLPIGAKKQKRKSVRAAENFTANEAVTGASQGPSDDELGQSGGREVAEQPATELQMRPADS